VYTAASRAGREPLPGLALLRVAQGKIDAAASAMRRILTTTREPLQRARYLPAHVEIMLAAGDVDQARAARDELQATAACFDTDVLRAMALQAHATLLLAEAGAEAAVEPLRAAMLTWQRIDAPYLVARLHVLLGRAFRDLGDEDGAQLEWSAARDAFAVLGAEPDVKLVAELQKEAPRVASERPAGSARAASHGLSTRELEVLRLLATGKTNRVIARELHLSEKTVDRHVSNIFGKIDVSSRAAATAFAYEHGLV
jgi:DNA-binding CsgD family transcriptional regulator